MTDPAGPSVTTTAADLLSRLGSEDYRIVKTVRLLLAPRAVMEEYEQLLAAFAEQDTKNLSIDGSLPEIAQHLLEREEELEAKYMVPFKVGAVSRKQWADLLLDHRPTRKQLAAEPKAEFDVDTFPAAAIQACLIDPAMTLEQVQQLEGGVDGVGGLTDAQFSILFNSVVEVNTGGTAAPKSMAVAMLRRMNDES